MDGQTDFLGSSSTKGTKIHIPANQRLQDPQWQTPSTPWVNVFEWRRSRSAKLRSSDCWPSDKIKLHSTQKHTATNRQGSGGPAWSASEQLHSEGSQSSGLGSKWARVGKAQETAPTFHRLPNTVQVSDRTVVLGNVLQKRFHLFLVVVAEIQRGYQRQQQP